MSAPGAVLEDLSATEKEPSHELLDVDNLVRRKATALSHSIALSILGLTISKFGRNKYKHCKNKCFDIGRFKAMFVIYIGALLGILPSLDEVLIMSDNTVTKLRSSCRVSRHGSL
jgi:hypothetical protein